MIIINNIIIIIIIIIIIYSLFNIIINLKGIILQMWVEMDPCV